MTGRASFCLLSPCARCSATKMGCSRDMSCSNCSGHTECKPSVYEFISRAKHVMKMLTTGELIHSDICKYQVNMQALINNSKPILSRIDAKDIYSRLSSINSVHPELEMKDFKFDMPAGMVELYQSTEVSKIEFMKDGHYACMTSDAYENAIITKDEILRISKIAAIPPKMVDTMNLDDIAVGYKMWTESVLHPMMQINYTGPGYWKEDGVVCYMTVRMMSLVMTSTRIITLTCIGRGKIYSFK